MPEKYVSQVLLNVPSGERLVQVSSEWDVLIDGVKSDGYLAEEALVYSSLCKVRDNIIAVSVLPSIVTETYLDAVDQGADALDCFDRNIELKGSVSAIAVKGILNRLQMYRLGSLSSNVYSLNYNRNQSVLLCTDITSDQYGLDIISKQCSGFAKFDNLTYYAALHERRLQEEQHVAIKRPIIIQEQRLEVATSLAHSQTIKFRKSNAKNSKYGQISEEHKLLVNKKAMSYLESTDGSKISSVDIAEDFISNGGTRITLMELINKLEALSTLGYFVKTVDHNDLNNIFYTRTNRLLKTK
ncbi:MAG: hypothetical protein WCJ60_04865 [bacterium]